MKSSCFGIIIMLHSLWTFMVSSCRTGPLMRSNRVDGNRDAASALCSRSCLISAHLACAFGLDSADTCCFIWDLITYCYRFTLSYVWYEWHHDPAKCIGNRCTVSAAQRHLSQRMVCQDGWGPLQTSCLFREWKNKINLRGRHPDFLYEKNVFWRWGNNWETFVLLIYEKIGSGRPVCIFRMKT